MGAIVLVLVLSVLLGCGTTETAPVMSSNTGYRQMYVRTLEEKTPEVVASVTDEEKAAHIERLLTDYATILKKNDAKVLAGEMNDYEAVAKLIEVRAEVVHRLEYFLGEEEAKRIATLAMGKSVGKKDWAAEHAGEEQKKIDEEMEAFFGNE